MKQDDAGEELAALHAYVEGAAVPLCDAFHRHEAHAVTGAGCGWQAVVVSKANAGYTVIARYKKGGVIAYKTTAPAGKTKPTVKGLKSGKRVWVQVRSLRKSGAKVYAGVLQGTWAK